jgi:uncharacterized membrane protein
MYVISCFGLPIFWLGHHLQFHFVRHADRTLLWINLAFLLLAGVVPFCTDLVGDHERLQFPVLLYAANLLALSLLLLLQLRHLVANPGLTDGELTGEAVEHLRRQVALLVLVPLGSVALSFYSPLVGMYLYGLLLVHAFVPGRIDRWTGAAAHDRKPDA